MGDSEDVWRRVEANKRIAQSYLTDPNPTIPSSGSCPPQTGTRHVSLSSCSQKVRLAAEHVPEKRDWAACPTAAPVSRLC